MTSGQFHPVPLASISVNRETRQRRDLGDLQSLVDSICRIGLIHPIVVTRDAVLVAGERRLSACRMLGWTHIPAQFTDELPPDELELIELEENVKRRDLSWQEINDATVRIYNIRKQQMPGASDSEIAERMGISADSIYEHRLVAEERKINSHLNDAQTFRTARDTARAANERRASAEMAYITGPSVDIYHTSFHDWAPAYTGPKFDVIHCDFPYGIASDQSGINPSGYDDSIAAFSQCCITLVDNLDNFCAPQAHIIFWFSMTNFHFTESYIDRLRSMDFRFDELPLIWHKADGRGIAPDPQRRPRRVYETAWFGWRGDRHLVRLRDNVVSVPGAGGVHPHEKAELAVKHFLEMVVDSTTSVLDPTCGSGSALRAARMLGARRVLGLESDEQYARDAADLLRQVIRS